MKRTRKLSITDYHPTKIVFSIQEVIKQRVNREAEVMYVDDVIEIPENIVYPTRKIPKGVGLWNLLRQLRP